MLRVRPLVWLPLGVGFWSGCVTDATLDKWAGGTDGDGAGLPWNRGEDKVERDESTASGTTVDTGDPSMPGAAIDQPDPGSNDAEYAVFPEGVVIAFEGRVWDDQDDPEALEVSWSSDSQGALGESVPDSAGFVVFATDALWEGEHTIRLTVEDTTGLEGSAAVRVCIESGRSCSGDTDAEGEVVRPRAAVGLRDDHAAPH